MDRRCFLHALATCGITSVAGTWPSAARAHDIDGMSAAAARDGVIRRLSVAAEYWREYLDEAAWNVLFRDQTERPHSSPLNDEKRAGTYVCAACHLPLFRSDAKYDSGTGWPSFHSAIERHIGTKRDFRLIIPRTEYHCRRCGGHQGHVFNDGPPPSGRRWCNNGLALRFVPAEEPLPTLRG